MAFTTRDRDNDNYGTNCADEYSMGWWHNVCHAASPTGVYRADGGDYQGKAMYWHTWRRGYALKTMDMKIRPV
jgi:hypothetical protein